MKNINRNLGRVYKKWTKFGDKPKRKRVRVKKKPRTKLQKAEHFHKHKHRIPGIILGAVDDKEIIYGARALNKRFPRWLDRPTTDFDIYSTHPRKDARESERRLDKAFRGDFFFVKQALHPGTWKVKSHITGDTHADYTKPDKQIPFDRIGGKKYVKLSAVKKHIKKTLKDPEAKYRWEKDRDALNRILIYEKMRKR